MIVGLDGKKLKIISRNGRSAGKDLFLGNEKNVALQEESDLNLIPRGMTQISFGSTCRRPNSVLMRSWPVCGTMR